MFFVISVYLSKNSITVGISFIDSTRKCKQSLLGAMLPTPRNSASFSNKACSFLCKPILNINFTDQPNLFLALLVILIIKQPSPSTSPHKNHAMPSAPSTLLCKVSSVNLTDVEYDLIDLFINLEWVFIG